MKIRKYLTMLLAVFSIVPVVLVMLFSVAFFRRNSTELLQTNVRNVAQQTVGNVDQFFSQRKMMLEVASDLPQTKQLLICSNNNGTAKDITFYRANAVDMLKTMTNKQTINGEGNLKGNYVRRTSLVNQRGIVIASDDSSLNGRASFLKTDMRMVPAYGMYISDIMQNQDFIDGQKYFEIAVPIYVDGVYQGTIESSIDMYYFNTISRQSFMETGSTTIIDSKGDLASDQTGAAQGSKAAVAGQIGNDLYNQKIKKIDLDENPSGVISYTENGIEKFGYYSRVGGEDWLIISSIQKAELLSPFLKVINFYVAGLIILALCSLYIAFLAAKRFLNPIRDISAAFVNAEKGDYLTRIATGFKGEFAGMASSFNHLISKIKEETDGLKVSEARYALMMEETNQNIFEWDIPNNRIYHTAYWANTFGPSEQEENPDSHIPSFEQVHRDEKKVLREFFNEILQGNQPRAIDVRMKTIQNIYIWCTINIKIIYDENHKPNRVIGLISDTDLHKRMIQTLESKSQTDLLTQLYNKVTTEEMIKTYLNGSPSGKRHGLVIVDIDRFKEINDTLGHAYGDEVLKRVSGDLKSLFRLTDIVGRIGGDEFMILIKDITDEELLKLKMLDICTLFHNAFMGKNNSYKISASVGGAIYPEDGVTLAELYQNADRALYSAKESGKDRYCLCALRELYAISSPQIGMQALENSRF